MALLIVVVQVAEQRVQPDQVELGPSLAEAGPAQWILWSQGLHHNGQE